MKKHGIVIPYLKKIQKLINPETHLSSTDIRFFSTDQWFLVISRNKDKDFLNFFVLLKAFLINMVTFLMILGKLATLGLLQIKLF